MKTKYHSYGKIFQLGHRESVNILLDDVEVEEKVDGSQFNFGLIDGNLEIYSRNINKFKMEAAAIIESRDDLSPIIPHDKLFQMAINTTFNLFMDNKLIEGYTYRGEAVTKPKHNTIKYGRVPNGGIVLFDVMSNFQEEYKTSEEVAAIALELGLESPPLLHVGKITFEQLENLLDTPSFLNDPNTPNDIKIEGVVIKSRNKLSRDGKMLKAKLVSAAFKEKHQKDWKNKNPTGTDIITQISSGFNKEAIWRKTIQHVSEENGLEGSPRDIGPLLKELSIDFEQEHADNIKDDLYKWCRKKILRNIGNGFALWYKEYLKNEETKEENA